MARIAPVVIPSIPHHVTQRGNRRLPTFFEERDYSSYLALLVAGCAKAGTEIWAYCLMPNHVHLLLCPHTEDGLRAALSETHRRYTSMINRRFGWCGHLWQERFASFPADGDYLLAAARYIELNPVRAKMVDTAELYQWSSAKAHLDGVDDGIVSVRHLLSLEPDWSSFLAGGSDAASLNAIRLHEKTGRPLGDENFITRIEHVLERIIRPQKRGPKIKIE